MLHYLKGSLIQKKLDPIAAIMGSIRCSEKTARNKINGTTPFTVREAVTIQRDYFAQDPVDIGVLFAESNST